MFSPDHVSPDLQTLFLNRSYFFASKFQTQVERPNLRIWSNAPLSGLQKVKFHPRRFVVILYLNIQKCFLHKKQNKMVKFWSKFDRQPTNRTRHH